MRGCSFNAKARSVLPVSLVPSRITFEGVQKVLCVSWSVGSASGGPFQLKTSWFCQNHGSSFNLSWRTDYLSFASLYHEIKVRNSAICWMIYRSLPYE